MKGDSPNQDNYYVLKSGAISIFGVFDGHGQYGHYASSLAGGKICSSISRKTDENYYEIFTCAFDEADAAVRSVSEKSSPDFQFSGTTAVAVIVENSSIACGWTGDSRAVLARRAPNGKVIAFDLSRDHKADLPQEQKRIALAGGSIRRTDGDTCSRVYVQDEDYPGLAMSRSVGDLCVAEYGVSHAPEVRVEKFNGSIDLFVLVCSDGVWEFLSSQQAVDEILKFPGEPQKAADALAMESRKLWINSGAGVVDDITVIVNWF